MRRPRALLRLAQIALAVVATSACGGARPRSAPPSLPAPRPTCAAAEHWAGSRCQPRRDGSALLAQATTALAEFRVDEALALLTRARAQGPYAHPEHVRLYEQLGIAYAYLEREAEASEAFEMLLSLDPGHLLSYTLSPKATFLFERVRRKAATRAPPSVQVTWSHGLTVSRPVPIDIEVIADPAGFLRRATLHLRSRGASEYRVVDLRLPTPGAYKRLLLPSPDTAQPEVLELYLTAYDEDGNEVLVWPAQKRPREIPLSYQPPTPWYRKWWIWAITGGVLAVGTGTAVYVAGRDLPDTVGGTLEVAP